MQLAVRPLLGTFQLKPNKVHLGFSTPKSTEEETCENGSEGKG